MDELVRMVAERAGLPDDKARTAVDTVLTFIKGRLPESMASQIDSLVAGSGAGQGGDMAGKLGGILGGR
jgi:hypothetical protein